MRCKNSIGHGATQSNAIFRVGYRSINSVGPGPHSAHLLLKVDRVGHELGLSHYSSYRCDNNLGVYARILDLNGELWRILADRGSRTIININTNLDDKVVGAEVAIRLWIHLDGITAYLEKGGLFTDTFNAGADENMSQWWARDNRLATFFELLRAFSV